MTPASIISGKRGNERLLLGLLLAATVVGGLAIGQRLLVGLRITNMTQFIPWGLWVSLYIYFIGLSAGSFLLSTLVYVFGVKRLERVGPLALIQAIVCMGLGLLFIFLDLGHPARFLNVLLYPNPTSILAWESGLYAAYLAVLILEYAIAVGYLKWDPRWLFRLGLLGIPIAVGVHGGTGAIFAVVKARPSWYSGLFPILFLVSALASGGALLTFLYGAFGRRDGGHLPTTRALARITVGVLLLDLLLLTSELLVIFYGGIPHHQEAYHLMLFGPYWWVFWFVELGCGVAVPLALVFGPWRDSPRALTAAGLAAVLGVLGVRLNIVIPSLIPPPFPEMAGAIQHLRWTVGYVPSANEWLVALGGIAIGGWAFYAAFQLIPVEGESHARENS
jgi:Ni/Fe-hydrogenase subunit HybB-like protein